MYYTYYIFVYERTASLVDALRGHYCWCTDLTATRLEELTQNSLNFVVLFWNFCPGPLETFGK